MCEIGVCRLEVSVFAPAFHVFNLEMGAFNGEFSVRNSELGVCKNEFGLFKDVVAISIVNSAFARAFFPTSRAILAISRRK
jgi:hypothetical protein